MKIKTSYSTVCEQAVLSELIPLYDVDQPQSVQFWQRGINDTYRVLCASSEYSLRIYRHQLRSENDIQFELAALNHLYSQGAAVAYPIARRDGGYITSIEAPEGMRYAILTAHANGSVPDYGKTANAQQFGASVAELHVCSEGFGTLHKRASLDIDGLLHDSIAVIQPYLRANPDQVTFLAATVNSLLLKLREVNEGDLDSGLCHGDCHGGNVHLHNGVMTHFDFDCCGMGLRVFEFATFRWDSWDEDNGDALWSAFLEGYQSVRAIQPADLVLVDTFVVIRHIWWMALIMGNAHDFGFSATSDGFINYHMGQIKKLLKRSDTVSAPMSH